LWAELLGAHQTVSGSSAAALETIDYGPRPAIAIGKGAPSKAAVGKGAPSKAAIGKGAPSNARGASITG
jgi:hypothetical protein